MKSMLWRSALLLALTTTLLHANVSVLRHYRLGENDPGATNGLLASASLDNASTNELMLGGLASFAADTPSGNNIATALAVDFASAHGRADLTTNLTDNFGLELWVKPGATSGSQCLVYNGNSGSSGWGLFLINGNYRVLFGGVTLFGAAPAVVDEWAHLALVRDNGSAIFYVNGVAIATNTATPHALTGLFAVASAPPALNAEFFDGLVDEVRVFTFAPGTFQRRDLSHRSLASRTLTATRSNDVMFLTWPAVSDSPDDYLRDDTLMLQYTASLTTPAWITIRNTRLTNGLYTATDSANVGPRYYRLISPCGEMLPPVIPLITLQRNSVTPVVVVPNNPNSNQIVNSAALNTFDVSQAYDPAACTPDTLQFHWVITYPQIQGPYTVAGITGYRSPMLKIIRNALININAPGATFTLTVTSLKSGLSTTVPVQAIVTGSALDITVFNACQNDPQGSTCQMSAAGPGAAGPATEPTFAPTPGK